LASALLVLGGARSGKSRYAVASHSRTRHVAFVATAQPGDADLAARIARHRAERPPKWLTIEEPFDVVERLQGLPAGTDAAIVDCVTVWVANRLLRGDPEEEILGQVDALAKLSSIAQFDLTLVSNEVGEGVHPETSVGLRFRDLLGLANQRLAAAADRVVLMVAGIPVPIKHSNGILEPRFESS
jgi:adenosylcobinamide kinase / adenosylcobinamide-phosphate guanylyltransferase